MLAAETQRSNARRLTDICGSRGAPPVPQRRALGGVLVRQSPTLRHQRHAARTQAAQLAAGAISDADPDPSPDPKSETGPPAPGPASTGGVAVDTPRVMAGHEAGAAASPVPKDMSLEPFRALVSGRRFMCTMCGKCCTGEGEIWVGPDEVARIARHLNLSTQRFLDTFTKQYSKYRGWRMLKTAEGSSSCVFLGADNKCTIHTVRPSQCSTYPWWPELMVDREWDWEKENVCEGFDHVEAGALDVDEAARQLREANKMTQLRLLASEVRMTPQVASWAEQVLIWDEDEGGPQPTQQQHQPEEKLHGNQHKQRKQKQQKR